MGLLTMFGLDIRDWKEEVNRKDWMKN